MIKVRREYSDLMSAACESTREPLDVDGESADVGTIIGEDNQKFHLVTWILHLVTLKTLRNFCLPLDQPNRGMNGR